MPASSLMPGLKRSYARLLNGTGEGLRRLGVVGVEAPPLEQRWRHWAFSLTLVHDSMAMARMDVPWWTYGAIAHVSSWLESREGRPVRAFEYGSGASTLWLARRVAEVHSVEHHRGFGEMLAREAATYPHLSLRIVEPETSPAPREPSRKEGHEGLDFSRYVESIQDVPGEFDLVVVDGRAREACLAAAIPRLAPAGLIVFDNSRRARYRSAIQTSGLQEHRLRGLTPTLPYPDQTSLLSAGGPAPAR